MDSSVDKIHVSNSFYDFGPKIKRSINTFELTTHDTSKSYKMLSLCDRLSDISDFLRTLFAIVKSTQICDNTIL